MTRIIIILIMLLLSAHSIVGQGVSDTIRADQISAVNIVGQYGVDRIYYKFRANKKCKLRFVAPRSLVYRGVWEIQNDTLICTFNRVNIIAKDNGNLKNKLMIEKFIICKGKLYSIGEENGQRNLALLQKIE